MNEVNVYDFNDMLKQVNTFMTDLPRRIEQVKMQLDYIQGEQSDIEHYMEFVDLNASEGFKAYKQLQDVRKRRRKLKDELEYLNTIEKRMKNALRHQDGINQVVEGIVHTAKNHETRTYKPRVRKDLFESI